MLARSLAAFPRLQGGIDDNLSNNTDSLEGFDLLDHLRVVEEEEEGPYGTVFPAEQASLIVMMRVYVERLLKYAQSRAHYKNLPSLFWRDLVVFFSRFFMRHFKRLMSQAANKRERVWWQEAMLTFERVFLSAGDGARFYGLADGGLDGNAPESWVAFF